MYLTKNHKRSGTILRIVLVLAVVFTFSFGVRGVGMMESSETPAMVLTDSNRQIVDAVSVTEEIYGSFSDLLPNTLYTIQIVTPDGDEAESHNLLSDRFGIIPRIPLLTQITEKDHETYHCQIRRDGRIIESFPILLIPTNDVETLEDFKRMDDANVKSENGISSARCGGYLVTAMVCQAPPQDITDGSVVGSPTPIYRQNFGANEQVWMAVNPYFWGLNNEYRDARLYVVNRKNTFSWKEGEVLEDVSGGYEVITIKPGDSSLNLTQIWSNPRADENGYNVIVDFAPFGVYNRSTDIMDNFNVPTQWVTLDSVSFNHEPNSSAGDALNIRKNATEDVHVPEWNKARKSYPAAYIKKKKITIRATFSAAPGVSSATIRAHARRGKLGNVLSEDVSFDNENKATVTFQVTGYTPSKIKTFIQSWKWYYDDINGSNTRQIHFGDSINKIFVILDQPQSPWTASGQTEPWTDVMEISCWWARGAKTPETAAKKITKQLFKNVGGLYDTDWGMPYYPYSFDFTQFALSDFVNNIPNVGLVNCYDMGKSLVSFTNAVGCGLSYRYSDPFGYLNCINAIGRGWTNNPFYTNPDPQYNISRDKLVPGDWSWDDGRSYFGNHAFGSIGDNVFDACLTVDTDDAPDSGPHFKETWMINIQWDVYKATVIDDFPLFVREGTAFPEVKSFSIY